MGFGYVIVLTCLTGLTASRNQYDGVLQAAERGKIDQNFNGTRSHSLGAAMLDPV